jgi:hypothetical protein
VNAVKRLLRGAGLGDLSRSLGTEVGWGKLLATVAGHGEVRDYAVDRDEPEAGLLAPRARGIGQPGAGEAIAPRPQRMTRFMPWRRGVRAQARRVPR